MADISQVKAHMEVVDSEGTYVGTVDKVEGERFKLKKGENPDGGEERYIEAEAIGAVAGNRIRLTTTGSGAAREAKDIQAMTNKSS